MSFYNKLTPYSYHLATVAILTGLVLTFISWMQLCTEACSEAHNYRLLGMRFEYLGGIYFIVLNLVHLMGKERPVFSLIALLMIAAGLGAETYFIWIQKAKVGKWCPVCLSIAASLLLAGLFYLTGSLSERSNTIQKEGATMKNRWKSLSILSVYIFGFLVALAGITKADPLQAAERELKEQIKFGNLNSSVEVFLFTDWNCPACRALEAKLEPIAAAIMPKASLTFVDVQVHPETLNFAPYNLAFMVQNKPMYLKARDALTKLSRITKKPNDQQVASAVAPLGIQFHELSYEDIALGMKYFEDLADKFKIDATPIMVIVNRNAKKGKKLAGIDEITASNVSKAIDALK